MNKLVLLSVVLLAACVAQQPDTGDTVPSSSSGAAGGFAVSSVSSVRSVSSMGKASSSAWSSSRARTIRKIPLAASGAVFVPEVVEVEKGERVQLLVSGREAFGFAIPQLRIHERVYPRRSTAIDVPTDVSGLFEFVCSEGCGSGATLPRGRMLIR